MEKDYKKFTIYDILILVIYAAGFYAYGYKGKIYPIFLAALIDFIFLYIQSLILKSHGIDHNNLIPGLYSFLIIFFTVISTIFANYYNWLIWISIALFAIMLYLRNKAVREKIKTLNL